jgi:hypothetical protein
MLKRCPWQVEQDDPRTNAAVRSAASHEMILMTRAFVTSGPLNTGVPLS